MAKQTFHCCYHCKDRVVGCHATCEMYIKEKEEQQKVKDTNFEQKSIDHTLHRLSSNRTKKMRMKR